MATTPVPLPTQPVCGHVNLPPQIVDETQITTIDVGKASIYEFEVLDLHKSSQKRVPTDQEVGEATEYKQKVIDMKGHTPLWAQNMQTAITTTLTMQLSNMEQRCSARILNSFIVKDTEDIAGLNNNLGAIPANFPQTLADLKVMNAATINPILTDYGLPVTGIITVKRQRLCTFIGIR